MEQVRPAIVKVETPEGLGTGVIFELVGLTGYLVTNQHVVKHYRSVTVTVNDQSSYTGEVVGSDATNDLAVVKICCGRFATLSFGEAESIAVGNTWS